MRSGHRLLALVVACLCLILAVPNGAAAAELLQVRTGTLLQVGDRNRNYSVELACLDLPHDGNDAAAAWLRQELPRRSRLNLQPLGSHDGTLVARVLRIQAGSDEIDLAQGLIAAGLASPRPNCGGA